MKTGQTVAGVVIGVAMAVLVLELLRRKALKERYAILWLALSVIIIVLSIWDKLLKKISDLMGVKYAPSALFLISLIFVFLVLIHVSVVLTRQGKGYHRIAQKLSILEEKVRRMEREAQGGDSPGEAKDGDVQDEAGED